MNEQQRLQQEVEDLRQENDRTAKVAARWVFAAIFAVLAFIGYLCMGGVGVAAVIVLAATMWIANVMQGNDL